MLLVLIVFDAARKELKWDQAAAEHVLTQWYSELDRGRGFAPFRTVSDAGHCDTCEEHYDFHHPGPQKGCVNFIQMMWAGTCSVSALVFETASPKKMSAPCSAAGVAIRRMQRSGWPCRQTAGTVTLLRWCRWLQSATRTVLTEVLPTTSLQLATSLISVSSSRERYSAAGGNVLAYKYAKNLHPWPPQTRTGLDAIASPL